MQGLHNLTSSIGGGVAPTTVGDTVPLLNAVMEATRLQQQSQNQHEAALAALRLDKEHTVATFARQMQESAKDHSMTIARLEDDMENVKKQMQESVDANGLLLNKIRDSTEAHKDEEIKMREQYDGEMKRMIKSFEQHVAHIQKLQIHILELEHWNMIQKRCWSQTGERSQLALAASHERSMITLKEARKHLEHQLCAEQSAKTQLEHELARAKQAFETEKDVLTQRVKWLEQSVDEERQRADVAASNLINTKESLKIAQEASAAAMTSHSSEVETLRLDLQKTRQDLESVTSAAKADKEEKLRLESDLTLARKQRDEVIGELQVTKETATRTAVVSEEQSSKREEQIAFERENVAKLNAEISALRTTLNEDIMNQQKEAQEARRLTDELIGEKDRTIASLSEQAKSLQNQVNQLNEASTSFQNKLEEVQQERTTGADATAALHGKIAQLTTANTQLRAAEQQVRGKLNPLEDQLAQAKAKCTTLTTTVSQLQSKHNEGMIAELRTRANKSTALAQEVATLQKQKKDLLAANEAITTERDALKEEVDGLGSVKAVTSRLSMKSLEVQELKEENKKLREALISVDAKAVTAETRLHHSLQEGANTSLLLEKGLRRVQESALMQQEQGDTKNTLLRGSRALRKCLEEEGYTNAQLPLMPSDSLDNNYLQEVLLDHVHVCQEHFKRDTQKYMQGSGSGGAGGAGGGVNNVSAIPTALRTPMIYRGANGGNHSLMLE